MKSFILTFFIIFLHFVSFGQSQTNGSINKTNPRGLGVFIRYGYNQDITVFEDKEGQHFIETNSNINAIDYPITPIGLSFDEKLINNWSVSKYYFNFDSREIIDIPPSFNNEDSMEYLSDYEGEDIDVISEDTLINKFKNKFSSYKDIINRANKPSLSADYKVDMLSFGKTWALFYPYSRNSRWLETGLGIGLNFIKGNYTINLCDPYVIDGHETENDSQDIGNLISLSDYRLGKCTNKFELINEDVNALTLGANFYIIIYSFIGNNFEFNIVSSDEYSVGTPLYSSYDSAELKPSMRPNYVEIFRITYRL